MRIALISLHQVWEDKEANKVHCSRFIHKAAATGADLVVFPEMTLTGFSMNTQQTAEDPMKPSSLIWFCEQAKVNKIALVMGYVEWNHNHSKARNRIAMIDPQGDVIGSYTKAHPFSFSGEDLLFEKGNTLGICRYQAALFGLTICYDLRFPELYQALGETCDVIITIANWPKTRLAHWQVLLQARAIENQVFMIGANRTGFNPMGEEYSLSSTIYSPLGTCIDPIEQDLEFSLYEIDLHEVEKTRKAFPVKQDRRVSFYNSIR